MTLPTVLAVPKLNSPVPAQAAAIRGHYALSQLTDSSSIPHTRYPYLCVHHGRVYCSFECMACI